MEQQRRHRRVPLAVEVSLESEHNFYAGVSDDISQGGIFLATDVPPEAGTSVELSLTLPGGPALRLTGVVRWVRPFSIPRDELPAGCGIAWSDLPDGVLAQILEFIRVRETILYEDGDESSPSVVGATQNEAPPPLLELRPEAVSPLLHELETPSRQPSARIRNTQPLTTGFLKLTRYEFETDKHDGGTQTVVREVMERGHAVGVLGYDPRRDEVVLVNEFRPGCFVVGGPAFTDNLCAGGIADGESAITAAVREMREETGLLLDSPVLVHPGAYVSSGGTSEKVAIVVGIVDAALAGGIHGNAEESEDIRVVVLSAETFLRRVRDAEISDLKTLVAGYWLAEHREVLRGRA